MLYVNFLSKHATVLFPLNVYQLFYNYLQFIVLKKAGVSNLCTVRTYTNELCCGFQLDTTNIKKCKMLYKPNNT